MATVEVTMERRAENILVYEVRAGNKPDGSSSV